MVIHECCTYKVKNTEEAPNCQCYTCKKDTADCCIGRGTACGEECPDYTPEVTPDGEAPEAAEQ